MMNNELKKLRLLARAHAHANCWSQRAIAQRLGLTQTHICLVFNGRRDSRSLLEKIAALPPRSSVPRNSKYRRDS